MPRQAIDIDPYQLRIERQITAGYTYSHIRQWLEMEGVSIGKTAFSEQVLSWGINRSTTIPATNSALISAIINSISYNSA